MLSRTIFTTNMDYFSKQNYPSEFALDSTEFNSWGGGGGGAGPRYFPLLKNVQTGHPAFYSMDIVVFPPAVKRPGREVDHSKVEVKNQWNHEYTCTPLMRLSGVDRGGFIYTAITDCSFRWRSSVVCAAGTELLSTIWRNFMLQVATFCNFRWQVLSL
jgi:hypothetical protein